jgi:hypothetical protein
MRIGTVRLPENLSLPILADVITDLGVPVDRRSVGRALQSVVIDGVVAPDQPTDRWRIPRAKLAEVVGACLFRRRRRSHDRWAANLDGCLLDAAEMLMRRDDLHEHVPKQLQRQVHARQQARWEAQDERRRQIAEAERRRLEEQREAWRRKQEAERELHERYERERAREARERVVRECYGICYRAAFRSLNLPYGDKRGLPEYEQLRRDFPYDRPAWWAPPPGMYEAVAEDLPKQVVYGYQPPDWSKWVPPYVPGQPWPWRCPEPAADGAAA